MRKHAIVISALLICLALVAFLMAAIQHDELLSPEVTAGQARFAGGAKSMP